MRYFKAIETTEKPFITFHKWADTLTELQAMGEQNNPLMVQEADIPENEFGVCPWKIVGGELVDRTPQEMQVFEDEYSLLLQQQTQSVQVTYLAKKTFLFDGETFTMSPRNQLLYQAIDKKRGNYTITTATGTNYSLAVAAIDNFLEEYYTAILRAFEI